MTLSSVLLQAQGLSKSYRRRKVVDQVSLEVASGEVVGLLGPNGAGKTTCFYMLVGLIASDAGLISLEGKPIGHLPIHRRAKMGLSYLPQENSVFRQLTVEENILAVLQLNATNSREAQRDRLEHLLGELQIEHIRRQPAIALSGGERRRVEIARALATSPRFVLLDEPFAGVDPIAVIEIQRIVSFLRDRGIGGLITDHNFRETLGICDRAYTLNDGKVLADGNPDVLIANEQVRKVYLGEHFKM